MNWEAVGAVAELLGAAGVIASLIYLARQIGQNSRIVEASTSQAVADAAQTRLLAVAQSPSLAGALAKLVSGPTDLTPTEVTQLTHFRNAIFKGFENLFFQYRQGLVTESTWRSYEFVIRHQLQAAGVPDWWSRSQQGFDSEFRARIEALLQASSA